MPTLLKANILTADGGRFQAPVANLSAAGLFLRTSEDLHFGQKVTIHLLGFAIPGEVLFISSEPVGVVVAITPPAGARPVIEVRSKTVEVVSATGPAQPWEEDTANEANVSSILVDDLVAAPAVHAVTSPQIDPWTLDSADGEKRESTAVPILEPEDAPLSTEALAPEPVTPLASEPPPAPLKVDFEVALDPRLFASAALDDSADLPPVEAPKAPPPAPPAPVGLPPPRPRTHSMASRTAVSRAATPLPWATPAPSAPSAPANQAARTSPSAPAMPAPLSPPRSSSVASRPSEPSVRANSTVAALIPDPPKVVAPVLIPDPPKSELASPVLIPDPPKPFIAPPPQDDTSPNGAGLLAPLSTAIDDLAPRPATPPPVDLTLPELDGDTVRFQVAEHFRAQFRNNLMHGGLVVRAKPLAIGTQRLLAIAVPGFEPYTVSARVIFHEPGKMGFMLDSFNLHKAKLQQMAEPAAQPSA
ncbi:MAG: hypothetical protein IPG45_32975 [Deltaproteobacteria bacterium]|nr:hypothetical protein [Deltaproteobacteria bacterium]